jgi:Omp85 superfamily domain
VVAWLVAMALLAAQPTETIAEIRIHGNVATPDDEVRRLAGVEIGAPVGPTTIADLAARLRATRKFERVEVLKRFASIADPTQVVLVIIVDEGAVKIERTNDPNQPTRVVKRRGPPLMFLPLLTAEDGYGLIYGAEIGWPNPAGQDSRLSFPLTWGGDKRAAAELEKDFDGGRTRLSGGTSFNRRTHPFFDRDEDRGRVWTRAERELVHDVRVGASAGWQHVAFLNAEDSFAHGGADIVVDTRLDPTLARNAIYTRAAWEHLSFKSGGSNNRTELEARGYVGLVGQTVLVVRILRDGASDPLPVYLKPMLGGLANVRGFRAGTAIGDTLVASSAELRWPLTSPLNIGKVGVSAFVDAGTVYDEGARLRDQTLKKGIGGSVWLSAAFVRLNVAVAHGIGGSTRVHFGGSLAF